MPVAVTQERDATFPRRVREFGDFLLRRSVLAPMLLMLGAVLLVVNPAGDFPLNDDWAYAKQVHELLVNHRFQSSFSRALAFAQGIWGALFAGVLGESYNVLRLSTLVLALVTLWATSRCALEIGIPRWGAIVCAAVVLANPIFLNLSYTFMTEVHFMAPFMLAGIFYLRALKGGGRADLLLGGLFGILAASSRQFGIVVGIAAAVTGLLLWITRRKSLDPLRIALFLAPWAAAAALYLLLPSLSERPPVIGDPTRLNVKDLLLATTFNAGGALIYGGLFLLPIALGRLVHLAIRPRSWTFAQWVTLPVSIAVIFFCATAPRARYALMPLFGNILRNAGTGPLTLRDTYLMGFPWPFRLEPHWWKLLTALCLIAAGVFLADAVVPLARKLFTRRGSVASGKAAAGGGDDYFVDEVFLLVWGLGCLLAPYHLVMGGTFDRYLLPAAPPLVVLAARSLRQETLRAAPALLGVLCLIVALPGLAAVQDYMAWNRARWQALDYLRVQMKAPPQIIDGGYEFNSVYTQEDVKKRWGPMTGEWGPKGFWVLDDVYAVSFNPRPGYRVLAPFAYFSWLGMEERSILLLRR